MAVFLAAGDESDGPLQDGPFIYGGFVAPERAWTEWFAPAWEERVLRTGRPIPYLHMAEIRQQWWRDEFGLTPTDAERRVEEAARIIRSMGSLSPVKTEFDGGHFRRVFGDTKVVRTGRQISFHKLEPDYIGFLGFVYASLEYVAMRFPDAEKVNFLIERKELVKNRIEGFYSTFDEALRKKGRTDLIHLLGTVTQGGKEHIPLQAADVAVWHLRRDACKKADRYDERRLWRMFDGRRIMQNGMTLEEISSMGLRSLANSVPNPLPPKAKVRPPVVIQAAPETTVDHEV